MKLFYSVWIILLFFILGIYVTMSYSSYDVLHSYSNTCPNILLQVGSSIWLYNSNNPLIENINPIHFNNIEEYYDFAKWQNDVNIKCPVLYVQQGFDSQGEAKYYLRNTPLQPFNQNKTIIESTDTTTIIKDDQAKELFVHGMESNFTRNNTLF
jgi:hypothetical protein